MALINEMLAERNHVWGSKREVAQELGLDPGLMGKLLRGDRAGVSIQTLERIARNHPRFALHGDAPRVVGSLLGFARRHPELSEEQFQALHALWDERGGLTEQEMADWLNHQRRPFSSQRIKSPRPPKPA